MPTARSCSGHFTPGKPRLPSSCTANDSVLRQHTGSGSSTSKGTDPPAAANRADLVVLGTYCPSATKHSDLVAFTLQPPEATKALPADIVVVMDTSGSMGQDASVQNSTGVMESHGLSVLDIVKHAGKTIIHSLDANDRFALVEFNDKARIVFGMRTMSEENRHAADLALSSIRPTGRTNLWDGLRIALEMFTPRNMTPGRNRAIILLTDGLPNIVPPRGHIPMLRRYVESLPSKRLPCRISTFGFGYDMDSQLLYDIADNAQGSFAFIPDSSFVGTIFVNALSNIKATMASDAELKLKLPQGAAIRAAFGQESMLNKTGRMNLEGASKIEVRGSAKTTPIGTLQSGQPRTVIMRLSSPAVAATAATSGYDIANCSYSSLAGGTTFLVSAGTAGSLSAGAFEVEMARLHLVGALKEVLRMPANYHHSEYHTASVVLKTLAKDIFLAQNRCPAVDRASEEQLAAQHADVNGQLMLAVSQKHYVRWGRHYLLSSLHAHTRQQCNNFKDKSVQSYGGKLFRALRDRADDVFCGLPQPKGNATQARGRGATIGGAAPGRVFNMRSVYYNSRAPCISGDSPVQMADQSVKSAAAVVPGDAVATGPPGCGRTAMVTWVVRTLMPDGHAQLVCVPSPEKQSQLGSPKGLRVTAYHPIRMNQAINTPGSWSYPDDFSKPEELPCAAVYSFVLTEISRRNEQSEKKWPSLVVGGIECASLGHGNSEAASVSSRSVLTHPYFGARDRVLRDLKAMEPAGPLWPQSHIVELQAGSCLVRDGASGLVCGLKQ